MALHAPPPRTIWQMVSSFLYVVGSTKNPVKVGYSDDVVKRVATLQIGNPDKLVVHKAVPLPSRVIEAAERACHEALRPFHRHGEWFNVDAETAIDVVMRVAEREMRAYLDLQDTVDADYRMDIFKRIEARTPLHHLAREATDFYLSESKVHRSRKSMVTMNKYIQQSVGIPPLDLFKRIVLHGQRLEVALHDNPSAIRNGYYALASAMNALATYYAARKLKVSQSRAARAA